MTTTTPFQDLISEHKIEISALPEKTQKRIAKFNEETDEDKKEALDESICGDIWDYIEEQEAKTKAEEKKKKHYELKKKVALDVSAAATAQPPPVEVEEEKGKKREGFMALLFGEE